MHLHIENHQLSRVVLEATTKRPAKVGPTPEEIAAKREREERDRQRRAPK